MPKDENVTNTNFQIKFLSIETQTPARFPKEIKDPSLSFTSGIKRSYSDAPIYRCNFSKGPRSDIDTDAKENIQPLLQIKIDKPKDLNMKTVQWLHETARRGCCRCGDAT